MSMTLKEAVLAVEEVGGCGDSSCLFTKPKGMATNGGCRCLRDHDRALDRQLRVRLANLFRVAKAEAAVQETREKTREKP